MNKALSKFKKFALVLFGFLTLGPFSNSTLANPKSDALCLQAANESMLLKSEETALQHINQALDIEPNNALYWRVKAQVLDRLDESEKALPCVNKSIAIFPHSAEAYSAKAEILLQLGQADQALLAVDQASKLSNHYQIHMVRASILKIQRKYDQAEKEIDKAVESEPNDLIVRSKRSEIAALAKHWQKAIDDITFCRKHSKLKNVSFYQGLLTRAEAYTALNQYDKALADCQEGINGEPNMRQFYAARVRIYTLSGNKAAAAKARKELDVLEDLYRPSKHGF